MSKSKEAKPVASQVISSPLKWHGGKSYLASKIVALMPPHIHYVEPYAGGLSVLLAKNPEGVSEVVNDLNRDLYNFWQVIGDEELFDRFMRQVTAEPFCEQRWQLATQHLNAWAKGIIEKCVYHAVEFFIACRQSLAGRMKDFATLSRRRVRRGMNEQASAWLTAVDGLPEVHARLKRVVVLNRNAIEVIRQQDGPDTLFYLDPPYLHETRATTGEYLHEMSEAQHRQLLEVLNEIDGAFLLSGYRSPLYDDWADQSNFRRHDFDLPNNAAGGAEKRRMVESIWTNF